MASASRRRPPVGSALAAELLLDHGVDPATPACGHPLGHHGSVFGSQTLVCEQQFDLVSLDIGDRLDLVDLGADRSGLHLTSDLADRYSPAPMLRAPANASATPATMTILLLAVPPATPETTPRRHQEAVEAAEHELADARQVGAIFCLLGEQLRSVQRCAPSRRARWHGQGRWGTAHLDGRFS